MLLVPRLVLVWLGLYFMTGCATPINNDQEMPRSSTVISSPSGPPAQSEGLPDAIATQVLTQLKTDLGITDAQVERSHRTTWPDGCLGLGGPEELCLAALVEGWQIDIIDRATRQQYTFRTDLAGETVRREPLED